MPVLIDAATSTPSVLLVRSRWSAAIWLFPKGGVDGGESAKAAAVRETLEEAGVAGEVWGRKLGVWDFVSTRQKQKMWLLRVTDVHDSHSKKWKERNKRERRWLSFPDARALMMDVDPSERRMELVEILDTAEKRVAKLLAKAAAKAAAAAADATASASAAPASLETEESEDSRDSD